MCTAILDLAGTPAVDLPAPVPAAGDAPLEVDADVERSWARRWLIGHHVRFLFEACAATALTDAAHYLAQGCMVRAVGRIGAATVFVQAFPAAVTHACAIAVAYFMLATRRSLAQPAGSPTNAVTELRQICQQRIARYAPLLDTYRPSGRKT